MLVPKIDRPTLYQGSVRPPRKRSSWAPLWWTTHPRPQAQEEDEVDDDDGEIEGLQRFVDVHDDSGKRRKEVQSADLHAEEDSLAGLAGKEAVRDYSAARQYWYSWPRRKNSLPTTVGTSRPVYE
jgi:hypothetical protein